ncbi:hypothetical protein RHMOL_RhmolMtG0004800 (mitochondrion) [Rhododendron molle]|nr:hypothetical protein RHMOL_RhmolMtG0004800 [Rhododendron molle]
MNIFFMNQKPAGPGGGNSERKRRRSSCYVATFNDCLLLFRRIPNRAGLCNYASKAVASESPQTALKLITFLGEGDTKQDSKTENDRVAEMPVFHYSVYLEPVNVYDLEQLIPKSSILFPGLFGSVLLDVQPRYRDSNPNPEMHLIDTRCKSRCQILRFHLQAKGCWV